jgi:hypothetical protein
MLRSQHLPNTRASTGWACVPRVPLSAHTWPAGVSGEPTQAPPGHLVPVAGRYQRMRPASRPPYSSSSVGRAADGLCSEPPAAGRADARSPARDAGLALVPALGRAGVCRLAAVDVVRFAVLADLPAAGLAVRDRLDADGDRDDEDEALVVLGLDPPVAVRAVPADLAVVAWPAAGSAEDIALAASVSDLLAVVMALVAAFMACIAVDIVLADDVALVAAAVILVAAAVTLVAADETVRAAVAGEAVFFDDARAALPDRLPALPRDELPEALRDALPRVVLAADARV